jgi:hypothetical protein
MMPTSTDQGIAEGVRWLLEQQTLVRAPLPAPLPTPISGAGGAPTVVIAAYNCTLLSQNKADLFCTGVNDDGTFLIALSILESKLNDSGVGVGGRIVLTEGDFYFTSELPIVGSVKIEGMGMRASIIHLAAGANSHMFHLASPYSGSFELMSVGLDGAKAFQTSGNHTAIQFDPNAGTGALLLDNVHIHDFTGNGLTLDRPACQFSMSSCLVESNTLVGVYLFVEGHFRIVDSMIRSNGTIGVSANGAALEMSSTIVANNTTHGFSAGGIFESTQKLVVGCAFTGNGGYGVLWDGVNGSFTGNYIGSNLGQAGGLFIGNSPLAVTGNTFASNAGFGSMLSQGGGVLGGTFTGNVVKGSGQHGTYIEGANWLVADNHYQSNGQTATNTYDDIHVASPGDDCHIHGNVIRVGAANVTRYGINVAAGATNNWIHTNDARAGHGTGKYNDAGTGTIWVVAGTFGDNY